MRLDFQQATVEVSTLYRYQNEHWRFSLPDGVTDSAAAAGWKALSENVASGHHVQLSEILDAMEQRKRPPVSGLDARRILEFIASLYKSAFTGLPVQQGSITPDDPYYFMMNGSPLPLPNA
jgi:predicted dehydrogenase